MSTSIVVEEHDKLANCIVRHLVERYTSSPELLQPCAIVSDLKFIANVYWCQTLSVARHRHRRCVPLPPLLFFFSCSMNISALVHRHAEAVVMHACRIVSAISICSALSWQLDAMDGSDEEMQLINDVALLDSQLEAAGCPCKEKMYAHLFRNFDDKPLAKRLKLWRFRQELG